MPNIITAIKTYMNRLIIQVLPFCSVKIRINSEQSQIYPGVAVFFKGLRIGLRIGLCIGLKYPASVLLPLN